MPLTSNVGKNIKELLADNKKKGKAKGNKGTPRSMKQIIAISLSSAREKGNKKVKPYMG
jgi:hypothetical protein